MKIRFSIRILVVICLFSSTVFSSKNQQMKSVLSNLPPQIGEVENWFPEGETEYAAGQDLYLLINGGAEIYYEYGFIEAVFQSYKNNDDQFINLEIYEMIDPDGAYGIYTFKTGMDGIPIEVGQGGWLESYFLNFWEGNFLITVTGLSTDARVLDGIKKIATAVDSKLDIESELPSLVNFLPEENLKLNGITYLRGNLALFNQDIFDTKDVFGLKEGVIGKYNDYSILLFQYLNSAQSKNWYETARAYLKKGGRFQNFLDQGSQFKVNNDQNQKLTIKHHQRWITAVFGNPKVNANQIIESLEMRLPNSEP
jgi:hypothetical protein